MDPYLYKPIFLHIAVLLNILQCFKSTPNQLFVAKNRTPPQLIVWSIILILFLGLRPVSWAFIDTGNYAIAYQNIDSQEGILDMDPLFFGLMYLFNKAQLDVQYFFLFVESVYIGCIAYMCQKMFANKAYTAFVVMLISFSFYAYATNGIRQGMACSILFLVIVFLQERRRLIALLFAIVAVNIHKSVLLSCFALSIAMLYRNTRIYVLIWVVCIGLGYTIGGFMESIFEQIHFIDSSRDIEYLSNNNVDMSLLSHGGGFRYDFVLYSMVPILVGCYFKNIGFKDKWYNILLNTYILINSFWILVNRSWLTSRIAYLSWFMYGLILIYPILKMEYMPNRKFKLCMVLLGSTGFSYFMWLIGKYM